MYCEHCGTGGECGVCGRGEAVDVTDPQAVMQAWQGTEIGRVMRAIDLGVFDDPTDARANLRGELSAAEWAHVDGWYDLLTGSPRAG